jgi:hypothetical protein
MRLSHRPITVGGLSRDNFLKLLAEHHKIRWNRGGQGGKIKVLYLFRLKVGVGGVG